eukprot:CAMPEP_0114551220 /NCGR_PEP_ID=MMETSP0114-20121206/6487_1 /TAXON_ID=31324 /ORGANISM="Goniomonas sp, Strain m" /LENGTH=89 /DNA_ID=CAMNT_0001736039 /DNA_START=934 /DNA_END=1199 /DNA_ORIENTATION=-
MGVHRLETKQRAQVVCQNLTLAEVFVFVHFSHDHGAPVVGLVRTKLAREDYGGGMVCLVRQRADVFDPLVHGKHFTTSEKADGGVQRDT